MGVAITIASLAYIATSTMAISAFFWLRRMRGDITGLKIAAVNTLAEVTAMRIKQSFDQIIEMRKVLKACADAEQYEDAKRIQDLIEVQEAAAQKSLEHFKKTFGEIADVTVEEIKINN